MPDNAKEDGEQKRAGKATFEEWRTATPVKAAENREPRPEKTRRKIEEPQPQQSVRGRSDKKEAV